MGERKNTPNLSLISSSVRKLEQRESLSEFSAPSYSLKFWLDKGLSLFCFSRLDTGPSFFSLSDPQGPFGNLMPFQAEQLCWKRLRVAVLCPVAHSKRWVCGVVSKYSCKEACSQVLNQCERYQDPSSCNLGIVNQLF